MTARTGVIAGAIALALGALFPLVPAAAQVSNSCQKFVGTWEAPFIGTAKKEDNIFEVNPAGDLAYPASDLSGNCPLSIHGKWICNGNVFEARGVINAWAGYDFRLTLSTDGK